jgi:type I restriction-modification system DNA methylase subunit
VIKNGFGYDERHYINEKDKTDIWLLDAAVNSRSVEPVPVVVVETKDFNQVDDRRLVDQGNISQAFKYVRKGATRYVALTNFKRFVLWRVEQIDAQQSLNRAIADVNLEAQMMYVTFGPDDMNKLSVMSYDEITNIYDDFTCPMQIDLKEKENFEHFTIVVKNRILDSELIPQFHRLAQSLTSEYSEYVARKQHLEKRRALLNEHASHATLATIEGELRNLEGTSRAAIEFENRYRQWEREVYAPNDTTSVESRVARFASETAYALLSRMLLIRIAEDKDILSQNISDGELARKVKTARAVNHAYKMVLQWAFTDAQNAVYKRLFQKAVYDWYWEDDGELNDAVKKALWHLNQYNFADVQRDVFKYVYQHHMDKEERKRIGEYYTPDEVVCYILDRVGYTSDKDLRQLRLLDPATGSGTFLVEAVSRLKKLGHGMTDSEILRLVTGEAAGGVFGLDINPFAVYLTEANLLFQMIDLIQHTRRAVDEFQVHRTDSLEPPSQLLLTTDVLSVKKVDTVKAQRFDFVVGNPPYVRTRGLLDNEKRNLDQRLRDKFPDILTGRRALSTGQLDLYIVFMAFGIDWLSHDESRLGRLGFITSGKFLTGENGEWLRSLILRKCVIEEIVDVMRVKDIFKTQDVYPVIVILRYEPNEGTRRSNLVNIKIVLVDNIEMLQKVEQAKCARVPDYDPNTEILAYSMTQKQFEDHPGKAFEIYLSDPLQTIIRKIEQSASTRLGDILSIVRGVERGGQEKWKDRLKDRRIRHEYGRNFIVTGDEKETIPQSERAMLRSFVDGDTVAPFAPEYRDEYLCYDEEWLNSPKTPGLFEKDEKIIIPRRGQSLFACVDRERHYVLDDAYVGTLVEEQERKISLAYVVGFLNSSTLDFYHKTRFMTRLQGDWFDFYDYTLSGLPIKQPNAAQESEIAGSVNALVAKRKRLSTILRTTGRSRELVRSSGAATTRGVGLSRLVKDKKGVDNPIETIRRKGTGIEFNRGRRKETYVEMTDGVAALLLEDLMQERYASIKGQTLGTILDSIEFPGDEKALRKIDLHRRKLSAEKSKLEKDFDMLKDELDWKIAELCGLTRSEYELMSRALKLLSTTKTSE